MAGKPEGGAGPPTSRSIVMRVLGQPQMTEAAPNGAPSALPGISPTRGIGGFADFDNHQRRKKKGLTQRPALVFSTSNQASA